MLYLICIFRAITQMPQVITELYPSVVILGSFLFILHTEYG